MHKIHTVILLTALLTTGRMYADNPDRLLATPMPGAWVKDNSIEQTLPDDDSWWQRFDDPVLNTLVDKATENNFNLLEAYHRREMARNMMLQARDLGVGSCWIEVNGRLTADGTPAEDIVQELLGIPEHIQPLCIVTFGYPDETRQPQNCDKLLWERVRIGSFRHEQC